MACAAPWQLCAAWSKVASTAQCAARVPKVQPGSNLGTYVLCLCRTWWWAQRKPRSVSLQTWEGCAWCDVHLRSLHSSCSFGQGLMVIHVLCCVTHLHRSDFKSRFQGSTVQLLIVKQPFRLCALSLHSQTDPFPHFFTLTKAAI